MDRERELSNSVLELAQDLANYRRMVKEDGSGLVDPDEARVTFNMTLVHCEKALALLKRMGLYNID